MKRTFTLFALGATCIASAVFANAQDQEEKIARPATVLNQDDAETPAPADEVKILPVPAQ